MEWIKISQGVPDKDNQYLCIFKREICILTWNSRNECWDEEDGDDYCCDPMDVSHYMGLPEFPIN